MHVKIPIISLEPRIIEESTVAASLEEGRPLPLILSDWWDASNYMHNSCYWLIPMFEVKSVLIDRESFSRMNIDPERVIGFTTAEIVSTEEKVEMVEILLPDDRSPEALCNEITDAEIIMPVTTVARIRQMAAAYARDLIYDIVKELEENKNPLEKISSIRWHLLDSINAMGELENDMIFPSITFFDDLLIARSKNLKPDTKVYVIYVFDVHY